MRVLCQLIGDSPHDESFDDDDGLANPNSLAVAEYQSIKSAIHLERACRAPLSDVLRSRDKGQNLRRLILSCGTQFMQQFAGINALGTLPPSYVSEKKAPADLLQAFIYRLCFTRTSATTSPRVGFSQQSAGQCICVPHLQVSSSSTASDDASEFLHIHSRGLLTILRLMMIGSVACGLCHLIASIVLKIGQDDASMALVVRKPSDLPER